MALSKAVEMARRMETDAIRFYKGASRKTSHPFGKKMFEGFTRDETRHLGMLDDIIKGLDIDLNVESTGNIRTVFSELRDQMMQRIEATTDEKEAIKVALEMEKKGYNYYLKAADEAPEGQEKRLFEILSGEEEMHYQLLSNTYAFLEDTGNWFMWKELSIVEGG
ncbi:putative trifunctional 2-polyprenylphenol hydroxylase/glutamate synthase subunit beta/ferritin domain-containing protein [bacterium BMS3Bbin06]|nr:putative trifunctional 2-polyprenylphenol hydroxylase/glutamate synthase subunit beta/ferritin domain-containing protein [bacterium BMS3Abin08]GBE34255.1 putative trifunctional 2-polyprenylphenol hydroxylase/glutamate synthase subunit beta/ferritin domain-containing protein [bacterium BMS3Bbin06]HDO34848.1 rubrerythrin [Nitrospirota bacterium]HDY71009.1 rubrerythrin [Nitrospirota bacterium]